MSLNEFLVKLAPDFTQLQYSPLFPDAYLFVDDFYSSHRPRKAEFSTKHQQTAIQWEPRNENDETASIRLAELCSPEFLKLSIDRVPNVSHSHYRFSSRRGFSPLEMRVEIAQISGDNEEVDAVMSRVGVVLKPHSNFQKIWLDLRAILLEQAQTENDIDSFGSTITVMNAFLTAFYRHYHIDPEFTSFWHTACRSFKESVRESSNVNLPMELDAKLMEGKVFDASMFWRDWRGSGFEDWPY